MAAALPESAIPFGKYLLIRRLAIGGMAEIWLARPIDGAGKPLVLKRILPQFASDPEFTSRFREEATLTLQLVHGNIVPVFEIGSVGEEPYIAMEHVPGYDLRTVLKRSRDKGVTAPPGVAAFLGVELLRGLDYAHRKMDGQGRVLNLVHRDISPSNVVVSWEGTVKLLDFGIAKAIGRAEATRTGVLRGKVGYMSPEQARGESIGPASDLFSTGVVIYELLTAQRLFDGDSEVEVLERVKVAAIPPLREKNPHVPAELEAILAKALTKEASTRWASAAEFLGALNKFLFTSGLPADSATTTAWLREMFPEDTIAEEFDARTATHGVSASTPGMSRLSPIAMQLGGLVSTPPPNTGTNSIQPALRWPVFAIGALGAAALGAFATAATGGFGFGGGPTGLVAAKAPGALYVNSVPSGAAIFVDGADSGRITPDQFDGLVAGPHDVKVVLADYETWIERALVDPGNTKVLTAKLVADKRELRVETEPSGATVSIAGRPPCNTPCVFDGLLPSQVVEVVAQRPGFRRATQRVRVGDQQVGEQSVALRMTLDPVGAVSLVQTATPPPTPAPTATLPPVVLGFRILPYGKFKVDGGAAHERFVKGLPLAPGPHEIVVSEWDEKGSPEVVCSVKVTPADTGTVILDFRTGLPANCRSL